MEKTLLLLRATHLSEPSQLRSHEAEISAEARDEFVRNANPA